MLVFEGADITFITINLRIFINKLLLCQTINSFGKMLCILYVRA